MFLIIIMISFSYLPSSFPLSLLLFILIPPGDHQIVASGFYEANMWNDYDFARYNISYNATSKNLVVSSHDRTLQSSDDFQIRG